MSAATPTATPEREGSKRYMGQGVETFGFDLFSCVVTNSTDDEPRMLRPSCLR
jgi:hypothetical protein